MFIKNPLQLRYPIVELDNLKIKDSIDKFLKLLISSNKYDSIADQDFGFCLEDFRYEAFSPDNARFIPRSPIIDHTENVELKDIRNPLYSKNIIGDSKRADTFARELKLSIERYERRLKDVSITMSFQRNARIIHIIITGKINNELNTPYYNEFNVEVW